MQKIPKTPKKVGLLTDRPTNLAGYTVACMQLQICFFIHRIFAKKGKNKQKQ